MFQEDISVYASILSHLFLRHNCILVAFEQQQLVHMQHLIMTMHVHNITV